MGNYGKGMQVYVLPLKRFINISFVQSQRHANLEAGHFPHQEEPHCISLGNTVKETQHQASRGSRAVGPGLFPCINK